MSALLETTCPSFYRPVVPQNPHDELYTHPSLREHEVEMIFWGGPKPLAAVLVKRREDIDTYGETASTRKASQPQKKPTMTSLRSLPKHSELSLVCGGQPTHCFAYFFEETELALFHLPKRLKGRCHHSSNSHSSGYLWQA